MADTDATVWPHHELGKELSNWGRWGADDQIGTLNFITPEKLVSSAKLVRDGQDRSTAASRSTRTARSRPAAGGATRSTCSPCCRRTPPRPRTARSRPTT